MATANLLEFAPSCDGAAKLFFVNVKLCYGYLNRSHGISL